MTRQPKYKIRNVAAVFHVLLETCVPSFSNQIFDRQTMRLATRQQWSLLQGNGESQLEKRVAGYASSCSVSDFAGCALGK